MSLVYVWRLCFVLAAWNFLVTGVVKANTNKSLDWVWIKQGEHRYQVQVARTEEERRLGLMGRTDLKSSQGMLFVFQSLDYYTFWMKNTPTPLDILWLDENKEVVFFVKNTEPYSLKKLRSPQKALYVLELLAGQIDEKRIGLLDRWEW